MSKTKHSIKITNTKTSELLKLLPTWFPEEQRKATAPKKLCPLIF